MLVLAEQFHQALGEFRGRSLGVGLMHGFLQYMQRRDTPGTDAEQDLFPTHSLRVIRSLGERNRLRILRYLQHGPRSFIEIVRHLELSKGITHDHISKLRGAGLVYAHLEGENLVEYTLRRRALEQVQQLLDEYIDG